MAILISIPIGTLLAFVFTALISRFPGLGLPELFKHDLPKWIRVPILMYLGGMWFAAGAIVIGAFATVTTRFINPDANVMLIISLFIVVVCLGATRNTKTVIYLMEIILIVNVPLILIILLKSLFSDYMNWDAVKAMLDYSFVTPSWKSISAATYIFTGYINLAIFNRIFEHKVQMKYLWVVPIVGFFVLTTTFFIPIGFHGTMGVDDFTYIWVSTADSIRLELGFVERVVFLYLFLYIGISLLFAIVGWHVGIELIKSIAPEFKWKSIPLLPWILCLLFAAVTLSFQYVMNERESLLIAEQWLNLRLLSEMALVFIVFILARRRGKA